MCPKKKRRNIQKSSLASRTVNQSKNSERQTKKNTVEPVQKAKNLRHTRLVHKKKNMPQAVKRRPTQPIKTAKNTTREQRLLRQKKKLEKKKNQTEISTKNNLKQPRLLHKKNNLKSISSTAKTRSKTVRNSKKSTPEISRSTTTENESRICLESSVGSYVPPTPLTDDRNKDGGSIVTEITTSIPSPMAMRDETNEEIRFMSQATETSITPSVRQKKELEKKKKQTEISNKRNLKQPRLLLHKKNNLKSVSSTEKTRSKTVRNSKKSTPEILRPTTTEDESRTCLETSVGSYVPPTPLIDDSNKNGGSIVTEISTSIPSSTATERAEVGAETNENRFGSQVAQTSVSPSVAPAAETCENSIRITPGFSSLTSFPKPSRSVTREADTDVSGGAVQSNKSSLERSRIAAKGVFRRTLQSNKSPLERSCTVDTTIFRGAIQSNKPPLVRPYTADTGVSRGTFQSNKSHLVHSRITDTSFSRGALQSNKSNLVPGRRVITPSTAVAPASVIHDEPSVSTSSNPTGFNRNLEPFKILDMAEVHDNLYFLMKWKGSSIIDLIPVKIANERCPQLVIQFYESRLRNVFRS